MNLEEIYRKDQIPLLERSSMIGNSSNPENCLAKAKIELDLKRVILKQKIEIWKEITEVIVSM